MTHTARNLHNSRSAATVAALPLFLLALTATNLNLPSQGKPTMVADIHATGSANVSWITASGNLLFFQADDGSHGAELWVKDTTGIRMVKDIVPGSGGSQPQQLVAFDGKVLFSASTGNEGHELWISDGTDKGTKLVKDILPGALGSYPRHLFLFGNQVFFSANDGKHAHELYKTDGTEKGTELVKDIWPGSGISTNSEPRGFAAVPFAGVFVFSANDGTHGRELWVSGGTEKTTVLLKDIRPGALGSEPAAITTAGFDVYFRAQDGTSGSELWMSNGSSAGTRLVKDIWPGRTGSRPGQFCAMPFSSHVYFQAASPLIGTELWRTDGTDKGTTLVQDINRGAGSSSPAFLTPAGPGSFYFTADDGNTGPELWYRDIQGQISRLDDTLAGKTGLNPGNSPEARRPVFAMSGTHLYFAGTTDKGRELWTVDNGATALLLGRSCTIPSGEPTLFGTKPKLGSKVAVLGRSAAGTYSIVYAGLPAKNLLRFPDQCGTRVFLQAPVPIAYPNANNAFFKVEGQLGNNTSSIGISVIVQCLHVQTAPFQVLTLSNAVKFTIGK